MWLKGPLPKDTYGWGGVVEKGQNPDGFLFADFRGDHAVVNPGTSQEKTVTADQVGLFDNSLELPSGVHGVMDILKDAPKAIGSSISTALWFVGKNLGNKAVSDLTGAITKAREANVPWLSIMAAIGQIFLSLLAGQPIDIAAIIKSILDLITK